MCDPRRVRSSDEKDDTKRLGRLACHAARLFARSAPAAAPAPRRSAGLSRAAVDSALAHGFAAPASSRLRGRSRSSDTARGSRRGFTGRCGISTATPRPARASIRSCPARERSSRWRAPSRAADQATWRSSHEARTTTAWCDGTSRPSSRICGRSPPGGRTSGSASTREPSRRESPRRRASASSARTGS